MHVFQAMNLDTFTKEVRSLFRDTTIVAGKSPNGRAKRHQAARPCFQGPSQGP